MNRKGLHLVTCSIGCSKRVHKLGRRMPLLAGEAYWRVVRGTVPISAAEERKLEDLIESTSCFSMHRSGLWRRL